MYSCKHQGLIRNPSESNEYFCTPLSIKGPPSTATKNHRQSATSSPSGELVQPFTSTQRSKSPHHPGDPLQNSTAVQGLLVAGEKARMTGARWIDTSQRELFGLMRSPVGRTRKKTEARPTPVE